MIKKKQKIIIKKIIMYRIFSFYSSINWSLHRKTAELVKCSLLEKVKFFCSEDEGGGVGIKPRFVSGPGWYELLWNKLARKWKRRKPYNCSLLQT